MTQPLEYLKILDLTRYAPGPYCTMILGDLGADIIKVEEINLPEGQPKGMAEIPAAEEYPTTNSPYDPLNRNKRSIQLNLKEAEGQRLAGVGCRNLAQIEDSVLAALIVVDAHIIPGPQARTLTIHRRRRISAGIRHFDGILVIAIPTRHLQGQAIGSRRRECIGRIGAA